MYGFLEFYCIDVCLQLLDCDNDVMIISLNLLAVSQKFVSLFVALRLTNRQLWLDGKASKPMEYVSSAKQRTIPGQTDTDLAEWQVQSWTIITVWQKHHVFLDLLIRPASSDKWEAPIS